MISAVPKLYTHTRLIITGEDLAILKLCIYYDPALSRSSDKAVESNVWWHQVKEQPAVLFSQEL